ncbi:transposase domain-containing protein [Nonomuraea sp. NPDC051941]|uniref:transposase domain-containing protein n=1 Tax=Nonomuraea sp. NPDC051941 TaxID=3364373 RepID=UPI0037CBA847
MLALVPEARWGAPARGAIIQARQRLGTEAVKEVFQQIAQPAATESTPGAWLNRRRVMAIDGFVVDLLDIEANIAEFSRDSAGGHETALPQARVVAISECARHAIVAADVAGCWTGEQTLISLLPLSAVDRGDTPHRRPRLLQLPAWSQARHSGAHLLWRVQAGLRSYWLRDLDDGSWLAVITKPTGLR